MVIRGKYGVTHSLIIVVLITQLNDFIDIFGSKSLLYDDHITLKL